MEKIIRNYFFIFLCLYVVVCSNKVESSAKQIITEAIQTKITSWDSFEVLNQIETKDGILYHVRVRYKAQNLFGAEIKQDKHIAFVLSDGQLSKVLYIIDE